MIGGYENTIELLFTRIILNSTWKENPVSKERQITWKIKEEF